MNIGLIDFNNLDAGGGTEFWIRDLCSFLFGHHRVSILTTNRSAHNASIRMEVKTSYSVDVHEVPVMGWSSAPRPTGWMRFHHLFSESDVVYAIFSPGGLDLAELLLQRLVATPVVVGHHQPVSWSGFNGVLSPAQRMYYRFFGFRGMRVAKQFRTHHVINRDSRQDLRDLGFESVRMIPYGIDTSRFCSSEKFEDFTLLYLGRLTSQKGTDFLPEILSRVSKQIPESQLIIAGSGDQEGIVRSLLGRPNVSWAGFADHSTRARLLAKSHVLVLPSRYEALGLVGLEALASGTPVVAFDIPGPREYVIDGVNGFLVRDIGELVSRILDVSRMYKAPEGDSPLSSRCRESVSRFDWEVVGPEFEEMLIQAR